MNKNPQLIILGGFAGAGKSTIAKKLSKEFGLPCLSSDDVNDILRTHLSKTHQEVSPLAHKIIWHVAKEHLKNNLTVVVDINMCQDKCWEEIEQIKNEFPDVKVTPIILRCSLATHKERIDRRGREDKGHLNLGGASLDEALFKYDYINQLNRADIIYIDANNPIDQVYQKVKNVLRLDTLAN